MQSLSRTPQFAQRFRSTRTILALILREVSMSNGKTALGYVWEIAEPVASILVITLIMGLYFRTPPLGQNFPLFYASGILPMNIFLDMTGRVAGAVRFSRALLAYPGVTFLDALIARFLVAMMTKIVIFTLLVTAIVELYGLNPFFNYGQIAQGLLMAMGLGLALGTVNCLLFAFLPLYDRIWSMTTRPLFLFSAIVYLYETVPLPYRDWLWWNPIIHMVGSIRAGLYPTYAADYVSVTYIAVLIAIFLPVSLFFMRRYWREILDAQQ
jgi:capsular polysaccharide transport system permease protein